jgi:Pvc16 N-terminal domain
MSSALAVAGVSAVLQTFLTNLYMPVSVQFGGTVTVSAKAPDIVQQAFTPGSPENQVNLFLHQVTHNQGWRNQGLPSVAPDGSTRLSNPPLALDLHYLLTAYGSEDWQAEALLGYALLMMHENPVLTRSDIGNAISKLPTYDPSNPLSTPLGAAGLANQIEMLKITPATLGREEMAWLWTALKADYRPTFPFQVSVVLIQSQNPAVSPLPVLVRDITIQAGMQSPVPTITAVVPAAGQSAATLGTNVTVQGINLSGATGVVLTNSPRGIQQTLPCSVDATGRVLTFTPPNLGTPAELAAGIYELSVQLPWMSGTVSTNSLPFAIAPDISTWAPGVLTSGSNNLVVPCTPFLQPGQEVLLIIGDQQAAADPFTAATDSPSFTYSNLQPTNGAVPARMRVDGIDSSIINMATKPPTFSGPTVTVT